jgi:FkbM family methyltransferase
MLTDPLSRTLVAGRRAAGRLKRRLFPSAEAAAWRRLCGEAWQTPRYSPGTIELLGHRLNYVDLLTLVPQWEDTFVRELHAFRTDEPAPRILDCGANVGLVTLYYKRRFPSARISAFEADPDIAQVLSLNVSENNLSEVDVVAAAVWIENGDVSFVAEGSDAGSVASEYHGNATRMVSVRAIRLRDILAQEDRVDLLKLDIEGAEHRVLADSEPELHRVRAIAVELHEFDSVDRKSPATLSLLERTGFRYAHGGVLPVTSRGNHPPAADPFPAPSHEWVERIYAWRE